MQGEWAQPLTPLCFPATLTHSLTNMHIHINTLIHTFSHPLIHLHMYTYLYPLTQHRLTHSHIHSHNHKHTFTCTSYILTHIYISTHRDTLRYLCTYTFQYLYTHILIHMPFTHTHMLTYTYLPGILRCPYIPTLSQHTFPLRGSGRGRVGEGPSGRIALLVVPRGGWAEAWDGAGSPKVKGRVLWATVSGPGL